MKRTLAIALIGLASISLTGCTPLKCERQCTVLQAAYKDALARKDYDASFHLATRLDLMDCSSK